MKDIKRITLPLMAPERIFFEKNLRDNDIFFESNETASNPYAETETEIEYWIPAKDFEQAEQFLKDSGYYSDAESSLSPQKMMLLFFVGFAILWAAVFLMYSPS